MWEALTNTGTHLKKSPQFALDSRVRFDISTNSDDCYAVEVFISDKEMKKLAIS